MSEKLERDTRVIKDPNYKTADQIQSLCILIKSPGLCNINFMLSIHVIWQLLHSIRIYFQQLRLILNYPVMHSFFPHFALLFQMKRNRYIALWVGMDPAIIMTTDHESAE